MPVIRDYEDSEIIALNSIGVSLATIAKKLNLHPSTVANRLKRLNIKPADTRRAFMEDVFNDLSSKQREDLITLLGSGFTIKNYVKNLIILDLSKRNKKRIK